MCLTPARTHAQLALQRHAIASPRAAGWSSARAASPSLRGERCRFVRRPALEHATPHRAAFLDGLRFIGKPHNAALRLLALVPAFRRRLAEQLSAIGHR